ncbi:DUF4129 domain-containing transglutaminase family protein [Neobacillus kokaensis]|uniref:Transglutaminase-like domain-containing protein n=1 Tax=Neobacillus kokaensis TaxID=2759023 RepID=A0ABQ3N6L4_9BACI|nr:transglutaminase domain-containing protein [Neobacillus kokaensis]GHH99628.1 hypothetical protein AM1BK_31710 [Neobacillus kokaensis]
MNKRDFPTMLLYVLGFLLLWEWLRPVEQLTETDNIEVFVLFLLVSLAMSYLKIKWIWQFIIKILFILFFIHRFYYEASFFQLNWLTSFSNDFIYNMGLMFARNWNDLSYEFRTFLLFILLWLMMYLIQYWLLRQQQIFIFFFMTLIYITVLDTFTLYDAKFAIVRTVAAGFTVMGMLTFYRIINREKVKSSPAFMKKWMIPLTGMIGFSVLVGVVSPKAAPFWPDPVPYLKAAKEGAGNSLGNGPSRIGYGTNDERLGGPFIGDNNPVFMAEASGKNYWKVETKDVYTGKGWTPYGSTPFDFQEGELVPFYSIPDTVETTKETATIYPVHTKEPLIVYPAGLQRIINIEPNYEAGFRQLRMDTTNEKIESFQTVEYKLDFVIPKYKIEDLRKTTDFNSNGINRAFYKNYTRVPENLPKRIKQLTEEITAGKSSWFDKAKAVEAYFGRSEYSYDQKNVALPGPGDDYVDQFLFETKRGYCDNFSTSMAVMLRTIGIPTRWVKGFTGGDFLKYSQDNNMRIYKITNNNAHSWVEVFLPNQGWTPFEPTRGFTNDIRINYGSNEATSNEQPAVPASVQKPQDKPLDEPKQTTSEKKMFDFTLFWLKTKIFFKTNWVWIALTIGGLAALITILYRTRGKWLPYILLLSYRFKQKDETINTAYLTLLHQLDRYGLKRKENQTLRNYAQYVDQFFSTREMTRLTKCYEEYLYHQHLPKGSWLETRKLWENLIKRTIA